MKTDASLFDNYRRLNIILTKFSKFLIVNQKSFNQITSVGSSNSIFLFCDNTSRIHPQEYCCLQTLQ